MKDNIGSLLTKRAAITSNNEAFVEVEKQRRFTFSELNTRSNKIANVLLSQNVKPGDRVATLLKNGIEFIELYFAVAKIGAVLVPVNWRLVAPEVNYIIRDAGATVLIFDAEFDSLVDTLDDSLTIKYFLRVADENKINSDKNDYDLVCEASSNDEPTITTGDDDLLFIMYTSGTTGHPKGVMQSHSCMLWAQLTSMATTDMRGDDRFLLPMPMFHVGCLVPVSQLLHRGATGVIMRDIDMAVMFKAIEQEKITITMSVPALLQFMLICPDMKTTDISSIRWIATGAAPVPVSLLKQFDEMGITIFQAYGLTESCGPGTLLLRGDAETKLGSCGKPQMHTELRVVDEGGKDIVPGSGEAGELLLGGRHMMLGYWNKPEATAEALKEGWLYTGDICTIDADGFIFICDRKKDMIISGGENIYPAELENVLSAHPAVQEAAVIGVTSEKWGESPLAIIVKAADQVVSSEELIAYCKENLAAFKVPKLYEFAESIPRNASGKLLKNLLREQYQ